MERLTFVKSPKYWNEGRHPTKYTSRKTFQEVVDRLAYYEDMEEQGRLVLPPCKVGTRVWITMAYGNWFVEPKEGYVRKFVLHDDEPVFLEALIYTDFGDGKKEYGFKSESFGIVVHLTREEAEKTLRGGG